MFRRWARARLASLTSYVKVFAKLGEGFAGGDGSAGGYVVEALLEGFVVCGDAVEEDLLDVLLGGEAEGLGFGGELGFEFGLDLEDHGIQGSRSTRSG